MLHIRSGATVVDATVGQGSHSEAMLHAAGPEGRLIAADWDQQMLDQARRNLSDAPGEKEFFQLDYRRLPEMISQPVDAVLMDFGVNLEHFEDESRGFSFRGTAPLDMRMDRTSKETAAAWLNRSTHGQIAKALREWGGEKFAGAIAAQIVERRKRGAMKTTSDLVEAVLAAIPPKMREKRIHPATRTFQAIRIQINNELDDLTDAIVRLAQKLRAGGRLATISYHSGEDACAKAAMRKLESSQQFRTLTKKPITPSESEIQVNPSSRSAKLRVIERITEESK